MRAQQEPEGQTQVLGDGWELGRGRVGLGLDGLHRPSPWEGRDEASDKLD